MVEALEEKTRAMKAPGVFMSPLEFLEFPEDFGALGPWFEFWQGFWTGTTDFQLGSDLFPRSGKLRLPHHHSRKSV